MDTRTGAIAPTREELIAAGANPDHLTTLTGPELAALEQLDPADRPAELARLRAGLLEQLEAAAAATGMKRSAVTDLIAGVLRDARTKGRQPNEREPRERHPLEYLTDKRGKPWRPPQRVDKTPRMPGGNRHQRRGRKAQQRRDARQADQAAKA